MKKKNNKGFTLAELLIVVAIIAVLVGISIPIFSNQLRKARLSVNKANGRAAYAAAVSAQYENNLDLPALYSYDISTAIAKPLSQSQINDYGNTPTDGTGTDNHWTAAGFTLEHNFELWTVEEMGEKIATGFEIVFYTDGKINLKAKYD